MKKKAAKSKTKAKSKAPKKAKSSKKVKAPKRAKPSKKTKVKAKKSSARQPTPKEVDASVLPKPGVIAPPNSVLLGHVEDFYAKVGVIAFTLVAPVAVGQKIQVLGHTTNFEQRVDSMQIEHESVTQAKPKDGIGIKVTGRARCGDHVYLLK